MDNDNFRNNLFLFNLPWIELVGLFCTIIYYLNEVKPINSLIIYSLISLSLVYLILSIITIYYVDNDKDTNGAMLKVYSIVKTVIFMALLVIIFISNLYSAFGFGKYIYMVFAILSIIFNISFIISSFFKN